MRVCFRVGQGGLDELRPSWRLDNSGVLCVEAWGETVGGSVHQNEGGLESLSMSACARVDACSGSAGGFVAITFTEGR